jgi:uncharacterized membrane protein
MRIPDESRPLPESRSESALGARLTSRGRLEAFSDGVMAIAITLTVLSIDVPAGLPAARVGPAIVRLIPDVLTYLLSFAVVGVFWMGHHVIVDRLARVDRTMLTLNLCFLACISLVPVVTELMNRDSSSSLAVVSYATVMVLAASSELAMWVHADRAGLLDEAVTRTERSHPLVRMLTVVAVFALSIPIAFASPTGAELFWTLILLRPLLARTIRRFRRAGATS